MIILIYAIIAFFILMYCGLEITIDFPRQRYYFTIYPLNEYRLNHQSAWIRFESSDMRLNRLTLELFNLKINSSKNEGLKELKDDIEDIIENKLKKKND